MLVRKHPSGASESGLHFIYDEDDAVACGQRAQMLQKRGRRRNEAALAELRLDDHGGNLIGRHLRREQMIERGHGTIRRDAVIFVA